jgi:hypothetical protein
MRPNTFLPVLRETLKKHPAPMGLTQQQLCALLESSQAKISRTLRMLRDAEPREAYICRWQRAKTDGGPPVAAYAFGDLPDAECTIRKLGQAERTRLCRSRRRPLPQVDYLTACFFGMRA